MRDPTKDSILFITSEGWEVNQEIHEIERRNDCIRILFEDYTELVIPDAVLAKLGACLVRPQQRVRSANC
jgi:hypothetical protein